MRPVGGFSVHTAIRVVVIALALLLCLAVVVFLSGLEVQTVGPSPGSLASPTTPAPSSASTEVNVSGSEQAPTFAPTISPSLVDIEALLGRMSLEEKVGQMLMAAVPGKTAGEDGRLLVQDYHLGGIVYFGGNAYSPGQTLSLSRELQDLARSSGQSIPRFIAIDHEGGPVFRFKAGVTHFPAAMALGATGNPDLAYQAAAVSAQQLRAMGINMSLGPVLDINDEAANPVIGMRAFGGTPEIVTQTGLRYIAGLQDFGVMAVAKHFPGHGSTQVDSHNALPYLDKNLEQLRANELAPFAAAAQAQVGGVMVGHIADLHIDPSGSPASLSADFVDGLLRGELGYQGVAVTDAMSMGAVTGLYEPGQAAVLAVQAGCDVLAFTAPGYAVTAHQAIVQAARSGVILPGRIDASLRRILALKARFGLFEALLPTEWDIQEQVGLALVQQISRSAIYLRGEASLPLVQGQRLLLVTPDRLPVGSVTGDNLSLLGEALQAGGVQVDEWIYTVDNPAQVANIQAQVLNTLPGYPQVLLVTWDAHLRLSQGDASQRDLLEAVLGRGVPVLVVAANLPYDLSLVPASVPGLATFGALDAQVEALVAALLAGTPPGGTMPVNRR